jgi:hypothetical protein
MRTGVSLSLFAFGAILAIAVHVDTSVINLNLIGLILMLVAVIGFALSPAVRSVTRRTSITEPTADGGTVETVETTEEDNVEAFNGPVVPARNVVPTGPAGPTGSRSEAANRMAAKAWSDITLTDQQS